MRRPLTFFDAWSPLAWLLLRYPDIPLISSLGCISGQCRGALKTRMVLQLENEQQPPQPEGPNGGVKLFDEKKFLTGSVLGGLAGAAYAYIIGEGEGRLLSPRQPQRPPCAARACWCVTCEMYHSHPLYLR
jgi:hypothetical protein